MLQFGHGTSAVETLRLRPLLACHWSFNSATAHRPWRLWRRSMLVTPEGASIRPRHIGRGDLSDVVHLAEAETVLQFGHGTSAVETIRCISIHGYGCVLQFGHGTSAVETKQY